MKSHKLRYDAIKSTKSANNFVLGENSESQK